MRHPFLPCLALFLCLPLPGLAQLAAEKKNWFDDPFFQVSAGLPDCPVPMGPLLTVEEQRREAHWRAERGTSCWLAGQCRDANAYRYDKDLVAPVAAALKGVPGIEAGSVWVVIQRRWVFLQGCVGAPGLMPELERTAKAVVPMLQLRTREPPRYPVADKP